MAFSDFDLKGRLPGHMPTASLDHRRGTFQSFDATSVTRQDNGTITDLWSGFSFLV